MDRLAVHALDVALWIKEIGLRRPAGHEEEDHALRFCGHSRRTQRERTRRGLHEVVQRECAEATGGVLKPGTAGDGGDVHLLSEWLCLNALRARQRFGVRRSSGAFERPPACEKLQSAGALQDARAKIECGMSSS